MSGPSTNASPSRKAWGQREPGHESPQDINVDLKPSRPRCSLVLSPPRDNVCFSVSLMQSLDCRLARVWRGWNATQEGSRMG